MESDDGKVVELRPHDRKRKRPNLIVDAGAPAAADIAFAQRLYRDHRADLFFTPGIGWFVWSGARFQRDETNVVLSHTSESARTLLQEAMRETDPDRRDGMLSFANTYSQMRNMRNALELVKPRVAVAIDELDADPYLFNVAKGTIDLRSGEPRKHDRKDRLTKVTDIQYDPDATAPRWYEFLTEVFDGDIELCEYIKRLVGLSLTASQQEHLLIILCGAGSNGKSTFVKVLLALAGEYGQVAPSSLLMRKYSDSIPTDVARLVGTRIVVATETPEDGRLDEERVKLLAGGEGKITARFMRRDFFEFSPTHHLWLQTNHKPRIGGTDYAIWRRIRLIPFNVKFEDPRENPDTGHAKDKTLSEKLLSELPGILNWAIDGAREWYLNGLKEPASVLSATKQYQQEEDVLADFIDERCVVAGESFVTMKDLYAAYCTWSEAQGLRPWRQNRFGRRLSEKGFEKDRGADRTRKGLRLKPAEEMQ